MLPISCYFGLIYVNYFHRLRSLEVVQYFQFDNEGNMFVFGPGSGFSGPSVKVLPGFELGELTDFTQMHHSKMSQELKKKDDIFSCSELSSVVSSIETEVISPTPSNR